MKVNYSFHCSFSAKLTADTARRVNIIEVKSNVVGIDYNSACELGWLVASPAS